MTTWSPGFDGAGPFVTDPSRPTGQLPKMLNGCGT